MKVEWNQQQLQITPRPDSRGSGERVTNTSDSTRDDRRQRAPYKRPSLGDLIIQEKSEEHPGNLPGGPKPPTDRGIDLDITV